MQMLDASAPVARSERKRSTANDRNDETRIGRHIKPQPNGCWLFNGRAEEYGATTIAGSRVRVHRFVYETLVGPIPEDHHLHHECETPGCCNPAHLVALSQAEHAARHVEMRRERGR